MNKLTTKSSIRLLIVLSWMVYFSSYITRINYGAILVEFIASEGVQKSAASLVTTVLFITYGTGQLISGYLGDKVLPQRLILTGLIVAVTCNYLMPLLAPNIVFMVVIWGINGFAQALLWPPLVKILTSALTEEDYARKIPRINTSSACATIAVYLLAPVVIHLSGWKTVFLVSGSVALMVAIIWHVKSMPLLKAIPFHNNPLKVPNADVVASRSQLPWLLLFPILMSITVQGMLRDGISTWMPTFVYETFHTESTVSILTGVALPMFQLGINLLIYPFLRWMNKNVFACIATLFFAATVLLTVLCLFGMHSILLAILLVALSIGAIYGINALQTCYLPAMLKSNGNISFLAGLLNSATYVGSALSTYLFATISEQKGWDATLLFWFIISAAGLILTLVCMWIYRRKSHGGIATL